MKVKEVVERIVAASGMTPVQGTCDQLIEGDWEAEVTGIALTFMATVDVIRQAAARGINLIITHEPIYYTGRDSTGWLAGDPVYEQKHALIRENSINIWRFHDYMHYRQPDLIFSGLNRQLGWEEYQDPRSPLCYTIPETAVGELAVWLKERLNVQVAQIIGPAETRVTRVGVLVGAMKLGLNLDDLPMKFMNDHGLELLICGEILEWTSVAYVRDAAQLGLKRCMIILGHNRTEEVGMQHLPLWLQPLVPEIPVHFIEAGEPFTYL